MKTGTHKKFKNTHSLFAWISASLFFINSTTVFCLKLWPLSDRQGPIRKLVCAYIFSQLNLLWQNAAHTSTIEFIILLLDCQLWRDHNKNNRRGISMSQFAWNVKTAPLWKSPRKPICSLGRDWDKKFSVQVDSSGIFSPTKFPTTRSLYTTLE